MDRVRDALVTREAGEGASDFFIAGLSPVGWNLEELSLDTNPPCPVPREGVTVSLIRLIHHDSRRVELLREERLGRFSGELLAEPSGLEKERRAHVFEKDRRRRLDELASVVGCTDSRRSRTPAGSSRSGGREF